MDLVECWLLLSHKIVPESNKLLIFRSQFINLKPSLILTATPYERVHPWVRFDSVTAVGFLCCSLPNIVKYGQRDASGSTRKDKPSH